MDDELASFFDPYDYYQAMVSGNLGERLFHPARIKLVREMVSLSGRKILEVGAGSGCIALPLAKEGHDVTAVEPSAESLASLRSHARQLGLQLETVQADGRDLPFEDGSFDVVILASVVHIVPWPGALLWEAERVCRRDGHLVVAGPWSKHPKSMLWLKRLLGGRAARRCQRRFSKRDLEQWLMRSTYLGKRRDPLMGYLATLWSPDRKPPSMA